MSPRHIVTYTPEDLPGALRLLGGSVGIWPQRPASRTAAQSVLVIGGFLTVGRYYRSFGSWLEREGLSVHYHQGICAGRLTELAHRFGKQILTLATTHGPVALIGHSLGGFFALALALRYPRETAQVITIASPVMRGTPIAGLQELVEGTLGIPSYCHSTSFTRLPRIARRITTIATCGDRVAPPDSCRVPWATNVVVTPRGVTEWLFNSHTGILFLQETRDVIRKVLSADQSPAEELEPSSSLLSPGRSWLSSQ